MIKEEYRTIEVFKSNFPHYMLFGEKVFVYYDPRKVDENNQHQLMGLEINNPVVKALNCSEYVLAYSESETLATQKQKEYIQLLAKGFPTECVIYKNQATMIINTMKERNESAATRCSTYKQIELLQKKGFHGTEKLTFEQATWLISWLKKSYFHTTLDMYDIVEEMTGIPQKMETESSIIYIVLDNDGVIEIH